MSLALGVQVPTPLLLPKTRIWAEQVESRVDVMDTSGMLLHLPFDLRLGFARYVVRRNIAHLKRYAIAPVYRSAGRLEAHPREVRSFRPLIHLVGVVQA